MMWWWRKKYKVITKAELSVLIFKAFDCHVHNPLNKQYRIAPDGDWLRSHTPRFQPWVEDWFDCDAMACDMMAHNHSFCIGMLVVEGKSKINHTLNIAVIGDKKLAVYDPSTKQIHNPADYKMIGLWI